MSKFDQLVRACKATVHVTVNDHRSVYEDAALYLKNRHERENLNEREEEPLAEPEVIRGMIERDRIVELQFYPDTPVGSYVIFHWDFEAAIDEALEIIREGRA